MSVRWASGAMLAILVGSVAADECGEYRLALALFEAADRAAAAYIEESQKANVDWMQLPDYEALSGAAKLA